MHSLWVIFVTCIGPGSGFPRAVDRKDRTSEVRIGEKAEYGPPSITVILHVRSGVESWEEREEESKTTPSTPKGLAVGLLDGGLGMSIPKPAGCKDGVTESRGKTKLITVTVEKCS